jgi:DNA-binding NarL/FixJ family response regulator
MKTISIYIVDDHKLFVEGITALISDEPDLEVIGYSLSGKDYLEQAPGLHAKVYLLDINMPELSGIELCYQIRKNDPQGHVLTLSMHDDIQNIKKMFQAGAIGYIQKAASMEELLKAIRSVAEGKRYLGQDIQEGVLESLSNQELHGETTDRITRLTPRELEVLKLIARDLSTAEIAERLFISERTVETHRKNIFSKTNARSVVGLVRYALQHGYVELER